MSKKDYRDIYIEPVIGTITQGSIFNGAKSRFYPGFHSIYGIVISPRCDIEQKKVPLYYYLPAIKMEDWMKVDFPPLYLAALKKDVKNGLKNTLQGFKESETILDKFSSTEIESIIKKHKPNLNKNVEERLDLWKAIETYKPGDSITTITNKDKSNVRKNIIDELIKHKNSSFYFLESEHEGGFVLRMREISRISPQLLFKLATGIEGKLLEKELEENDLRQLEDEEIFMPLYVVKSPFIEHIMQHFLQQFNKIGIEDVPEGYTVKFTELIV